MGTWLEWRRTRSGFIFMIFFLGLFLMADIQPLTKIRVLFVCMGNICRSPSAEGAFTALVEKLGVSHYFDIDSAGTHSYHVGDPPDARSQKHARKRGIELSHLRGRQVNRRDFETFDFILAMDQDNLDGLLTVCPPKYQSKVALLLSYVPEGDVIEVPDPYYGGEQGFEDVLDLVEAGSIGLLWHINQHHTRMIEVTDPHPGD